MVARGSARSLDSCRSGCPHDCPCELPKRGLQSQQEPSRPIGEAKETEGFTRKIEDGREAGFRLANRRLQPLGHLTAVCKCTSNQHLCNRFCQEATVFRS